MDTSPASGNGLRFDKTVTLGTVIQLVTILMLGVIGYTTMQNNQDRFLEDQKQLRVQVQQIADKQELSGQLSEREAAILDGIEKRITRVENEEDRIRR